MGRSKVSALWKLRTWYKVHKWLAVVTGAAILGWLLSGIAMVLPGILPGLAVEAALAPRQAPAWDEMSLSPAAAASLAAPAGDATAVSLQQTGAELLLAVRLADGSWQLRRAGAGEPVAITAKTAAAFVNRAFGPQPAARRVDFLERHTLSYPFGDLPVYRLVLDDAAGRHVTVSPDSGAVSVTSRRTRLFYFFEAVHTFALAGVLLEGETAVTLLLWAAIAASLLTVLAGGYLALPHRRRAAGRTRQVELTGWLRRLRSWYTLHRWLSIGTGLVLAMWLLTGITMTWRHVFRPAAPPPPPISLDAMTVSPAAGAAAVIGLTGAAAPVRQMRLTPLLDRLAYVVELANGWQFLVDAGTARPVQVDTGLVVPLARQLTGRAETPVVTRIEAHSPTYPYGPVPVFEAAFADRRQTHVYVSPANGLTWQNTRWDRLRTLVGSLHTFDALRVVMPINGLIALLLAAAGALAVLTAVTGYYLALPARWQWLTRRTRDK